MGSLLDPTAEEFRPSNLNCKPVPFPTRSLLLSFEPSVTPVTEPELRSRLEAFGELRGVQMERFRHGTVTAHFFDLRHAETAFAAIPHLALPSPASGVLAAGTLWARYTLPARDALPEQQNQGTLSVFSLDSEMDSVTLLETFQAFGSIKEIRYASSKEVTLVEFFDIRDAAKALKHMNGKHVHGKQVIVEFSDGTSTISISKLWPGIVPRTGSQCFSEVSHHSNVYDGSNIQVPRASLNSGERNRVQKQSKHYGRVKEANKKDEIRFLIKEDATGESSCVDSRTTVMIKNIPNKYSQKLLLNMLDSHCIHCNEKIGDGNNQILSSYDFVYLPIDFKNRCNVGYGFVNMTSPEATLRLYKALHLQPWELFHSRKICELTYARVQGLEALKEHFKNSKFPYEMEQYLPVVFLPPRDGKQMTEPFPMVAQKLQTTIPPIAPHTDDMLACSM
ncbi:hypothetical protein Fmac_004409 [Flemingia macrophylla]|uniref:RRM domain-containing protein n=1 Tax=Flemingia macrophylla TaxID=520843 RepID=A0ABD1N512_9FABA